MKQVSEVFGISNTVLLDSYVDRGHLDEELGKYLSRPGHIALRGESKCGKSWLRQKNIPNAITVQCRLEKTVLDIYVDALSQLDIRLDVEQTNNRKLKGRIEAKGSVGAALFSKLGIGVSIEGENGNTTKVQPVGQDVSDLRFVATIINASGKRLVVEDFHYMSAPERRHFAFDMKAMWDYGLFVVVVGVWSTSNMLLHLNPDLTGRVHEISIYWSDADLRRVMVKGGAALKVSFTPIFQSSGVATCFGNVGILQSLILRCFDELRVTEEGVNSRDIGDTALLDTAALFYAEQLNPLYQQFAARIVRGIRHRKDSTGIYAHAMAVILDASDEELQNGLSLDRVFEVANQREARIQKGNLRTVLERFEQLQVDADGRGLVLAYNGTDHQLSVVDRQLLLYRKYSTVKWPWEDMIAEADRNNESYESPNVTDS